MLFAETQALVFDKDDTFTESFLSVVNLYLDFARSRGLPAPEKDRVLRLWGQSIPQIIQGLWPGLNGEKEWPGFSEFAHETGFKTPVFPYARQTFLELREMGIRLGIVTSSSRQGLSRSIGELAIVPDPFVFAHTPTETGVVKPNRLVFSPGAEVLRRFGIEETQIAYVGDSLVDLTAARNRRWGFVAVTTGFTSRKMFIAHGLSAEQILENISELPGFIRDRRMRLTAATR